MFSNEAYQLYWDQHTRSVGHRHAVTHFSEEEYKDLYWNVFKQTAPLYPQKMLDYGCGPALLHPLVSLWYPRCQYSGADISEEMVAYCRQTYPDSTFYKVPEEDIPGQYDFITVHSVFTHISEFDAHQLLSKLKRLMEPGAYGSFSIHTDCPGGWKGNIARIDYEPEYFEQMLADHGFAIRGLYDGIQRYYGVTA